jgi:hypothetical protein
MTAKLTFGSVCFEQFPKNALCQGTTSQLAEKTHVSEGYGLQAVRKCFATNPALAAEGRLPLKQHFFRSLFSRAEKGQ